MNSLSATQVGELDPHAFLAVLGKRVVARPPHLGFPSRFTRLWSRLESLGSTAWCPDEQ